MVGVFLAFFIPDSAAFEAMDRTYLIHLRLSSADDHVLEVEQDITLTNKSNRSLPEVPIVLYPNRFLQELPNLNDLNYRLLYPHGFSKGSVTVEGLTVDGVSMSLEEWKMDRYPGGTLKKITLAKPWEPKQTLKVHLKLAVRVPQKYGSFGWYRKRMSLAGAWYAYVPSFDDQKGFLFKALPAPSIWNVTVTAPNKNIVLAGQYFNRGTPAKIENTSARQVSVFFDSENSIKTFSSRMHQVSLVMAEKERTSVKTSFEELIAKWLDYVGQDPELAQKPGKITVVQAPVREALVKSGEKMFYVSDRAFKVVDALKQYHTAPIIAGLFYQLFFDHVSSLEDSENYDVMLELLAWYWTEKFMQHMAYANRDARNIKAIRLFSFVPMIDQLLYSPQFAFVDTFYDSVYPYDPVRDDNLRFNHLRARGRTLFVKLEDEVGAERLHQDLRTYLDSRKPFFEIVGHGRKDDLQTKINQWLAPRPAVNYVLQEKSSKVIPQGYRNEVTVKKVTKADFAETVELGVVTKADERKLYAWDGQGKEHTFEFETKGKPKLIELDPRGRLYETDLSDNRTPPRMKFVLTQIIMNYDFNQQRPEALVSGQFRKTFGGYNRYEFGGFYFGDVYGGQVGYTRLFGRLIDRLRLSHGVNLTYQFSHVTTDDVVVRDPSLAKPALGVLSGPSNLTSLTLSYFTGNQLSLTNPLSGGYASVGTTVGLDALGGDHNYYVVSSSGSWLWRLFKNPNHLIAVRGEVSFSGTEDMPTQAYQRLGGLFGMRGLSYTDDRFRGRHILMGSGEYRHFLHQDMDVNLGLFRVRGMQGALFADAGRVTSTAQELGNRLVVGPSVARTEFVDLFDVRRWEGDVGYGLRFHIEYLGVNPGLLRFDVAKSLSEETAPLRYYFGVTQSF